ncbi:cupin domain-containing protein [Candidatus Methanomassiliicoccus intestinalis]|mgnify:CR=1 FL=1|uniref:cupin domain-containing protein n=1 Tax=Candidatus Methanomassiliicoccus intestinalis TaxID=1406512 RepID=UPI0037DC2BDA
MKHFASNEVDWITGRGYRKKKLLTDTPLPAQVDLLQEVRFSQGSSMPDHYHQQQTEIFYALADGHIFINGDKIMLAQGDILVCEPGDVHGISEITKDFGFLVLKVNYDENDTIWL